MPAGPPCEAPDHPAFPRQMVYYHTGPAPRHRTDACVVTCRPSRPLTLCWHRRLPKVDVSKRRRVTLKAMGNLLCCVCKERKSGAADDGGYGYHHRRQSSLTTEVSDGTEQRRRSSASFGWHGTRGSLSAPAADYVERLILETLSIIRTLVDK